MDRKFWFFAGDDELVYSKGKKIRESLFGPFAGYLANLGITPTILSYTGLFMIVPFLYFFASNPWLSFFFLLLNMIMDGLDGVVARFMKVDSNKGAFVDFAFDYTFFIIVFFTFVFYGLMNPFWSALYILNYIIMQGLIIFAFYNKIKLFPVIRSKYIVYFFFFIWVISGFNLLNWLVVLMSVYMIVTNIFIFNSIKCRL